jgi:hypothetical protein
MAQFPQGVSHVDARCTSGERRVLHQLKRCLGDDHLVWHNVPLGPRARQPDFVILSPRQGVLLLEVKDWRRSTLNAANPDRVVLRTARGEVIEANPLRQARDYALELVDLMQRDPTLTHASGAFAGKLLFPYGWGVVFSHLSAAEVAGTDFHEVFPAHQVLLREALDEAVDPVAFTRHLWGLFTVHFPHTLTLPQRDRIRWHLFPELRVGGGTEQAQLEFGTPPAAPPLPDLLQVMDLQQEQIARTLGEGHRVIHGAAGSGKTMILVFRARHLAAAARPEAPVLVLCFNKTLADRIEHQLVQRGVVCGRGERVLVRTFHAWCSDVVRSYQLDVPRGLPRDEHFRRLVQIVERAVQSGFVPGGQYSALLVDEAHDFADDWLRLAVRLVNPATRSLLVLYDDAQSIYQVKRRRFSFASVGIEARGRTSILALNYRNTAEVLALSMHIAQSLLTPGAAAERGEDAVPLVQPTSAGRRGKLPVLIEAPNAAAEAELVAERIAAALGTGLAPDEIAVLTRTKQLMRPIEEALTRRGIGWQSMRDEAFRHFDWKAPKVRLVTLHSAKGLEFPLVFVAGLQAMPMADESPEEAARLLYVAMTRATHELVLSAHGAHGAHRAHGARGESTLVQRVRASLAEVSRQFATG